MSLLARVMTASGQSNASYLRGGRHVVRVSRIELAEPNAAQGQMKPRFTLDGELLHSDRPSFASNQTTESDDGRPANKKGMIVRANDPFKYPDSALARVRRFITVAKGSKTGEEVMESTLGIVRKDGQTDAEFSTAIAAEAERLLGPSQPLKGAVIVIIGSEGKNQKTGTPYTLFEPVLPTEEDLRHAGLI